VVFTPGLVAGSLVDPACLQVLELWRDGRLAPVVSRALLRRYLHALSRLGVRRGLLRRWTWWFTAQDRSHLVEGTVPAPGDLAGLCEQLAIDGHARWIITSGRLAPSANAQPRQGQWVAARQFLAQPPGFPSVTPSPPNISVAS
jgi:hypothetical protein